MPRLAPGLFTSVIYIQIMSDTKTELILYTAVHAKKGILENIAADTSFQAAEIASIVWRLKSTAGIDVYRQDITYTLT